MNAPIKFRVWDKNFKSWGRNTIDSFYLHENGNIYYSARDFDGLEQGGQERYIMQFFIGLTDKNNKDIYEGDIVKCQRVEYGQETTVIKEVTLNVKSNIHTKVSNGADYWITYEDIEVIGNIFENPELLKK